MIAAIYARKSTDQNGVSDEQRSVARQVEHARAYAARKGWIVADEHVYIDDGISGAEFAKRPGFVRLMNALKPRAPFQVLIMSEESRLGREAIETAYALKQLVEAGVQVWLYLENRQRTLDSPTDKIMLSLTAFADELEREKARQRTYDAMIRKARAGHVTGGRVFGYDNVEVRTPDGQRSHVERRINEAQAAIIRHIFELCATGYGCKRIAAALNAQRAPCPRAQQGRINGWTHSTVREVLFREMYRGEHLWNRTRSDASGRQRTTAEGEWVRLDMPAWRIVSDDLWAAAHARLASARKVYLRGTQGALWGRPTSGTVAKYLLTGIARCGVCGGGLTVRSRAHGRQRSYRYVCATHHYRGKAICGNGWEMRREVADDAVLRLLEEDVLRPTVLSQAIALAVEAATSDAPADVRAGLVREASKLEGELRQLTQAIATGGELASLLTAIREREQALDRVRGEIAACDAQAMRRPRNRKALEALFRARLKDWRGLLTRNVPEARQVLQAVLTDRLVFDPMTNMLGERCFTVRGSFALGRFFEGILSSQGMASPTGFEPVFQP